MLTSNLRERRRIRCLREDVRQTARLQEHGGKDNTRRRRLPELRSVLFRPSRCKPMIKTKRVKVST
jgi:hypothetical protein